MAAGSKVDISWYGAGLQLVPSGRTARLEREGDVLVLAGDATLTDDEMFKLIEEGRR